MLHDPEWTYPLAYSHFSGAEAGPQGRGQHQEGQETGPGGRKVFEPSSVAWPAEGQEETEAGLKPTQAEAREGEDAWK